MISNSIKSSPMSVGSKKSDCSESPAAGAEAQRRHHKRTSPEASVSLRHAYLSSSAAEPNKAFALPPKLQHGDPTSNRSSASSSQHRRPAGQVMWAKDIQSYHQPPMNDTDRESAFHSNGSNERSVPDDWFKHWNTNVGDFNQPNSADGDSPYYLTSERQRRKQKNQLNPNVKAAPPAGDITRDPDPIRSLPLFNPSFPSMLPTQDSDDESEVYRSVIDDLTIKNKKLKKKLRKMERLHCNELNEEKLFELRCYGLPPSRKQELQELLQKFAAELENGGVYETKRSDAISNANATSSTNPSSSSLLQNTDSAYATETRMTSMDSSSVDVSKAPKSQVQLLNKSKLTPNIIPDIQPVQFASERAKMKLVVRRLEQLFTGSDALQSELEKAKVQQRVAVAAAQEKVGAVAAADELAESGDEDDRREASMMSHQQDDDFSKGQNQEHRHSLDTSHQRPTRPMDLDPFRAQVAAENVEYLEQMSHSSSLKRHEHAVAGEVTDWVYLNLINNMAQIHTLNVSLHFIKKAIRSMSDKLELSSDGDKVRWRGGLTGTRLSSDGDTSSSMMENSSSGGGSSPGEVPTSSKSRGNPTPTDGKSVGAKAISTRDVKSRLSLMSSPTGAYSMNENFRYRPLMFHSPAMQKTNSADSSDQGSSDGESEAGTTGSGGPPPILESGSNIEMGDIGKFAPLDGPVIYFGGAPFCTDLSAQVVFREGGHSSPRAEGTSMYKRLVEEPVGAPAGESCEEEELRELSKMDWASSDVGMSISDGSDEHLPDLTLTPTSSEAVPTVVPPPLPFEASGLAGVRPDDNFVVYVKTEQSPTLAAAKPRRIFHSLDLLNGIHAQRQQQAAKPCYDNEVIDAIQVNLPPSKMPDPSFAFSLSEGSSDPFLSNSDEPRSYESAYNIEVDSRSSGEGIPSFHSPDLDDQSPMDLDAEEEIAIDGNPLAPLSVVATAGNSEYGGSDAGDPPSLKEMPILKSLDDMDIGGSDVVETGTLAV
ncbi:hypothetical protein Dda_0839 [Drechslerella dactyloides]|uniref:Frequency clock protein n=1 Tax=Drechslerella dactyloides TaxID=74499 RepID=A0AAD6J728_DREDA|nr:hypothetical protein Dda_0839 [Drechslerella dactyloides]